MNTKLSRILYRITFGIDGKVILDGTGDEMMFGSLKDAKFACYRIENDMA